MMACPFLSALICLLPLIDNHSLQVITLSRFCFNFFNDGRKVCIVLYEGKQTVRICRLLTALSHLFGLRLLVFGKQLMLKGALNAVSNQQSIFLLEHARSLPGKLFEVGKLDRKPPWAGVASERAGRCLTPPVSGHRPWKYNNIQFRKF